MADIVFLHGMEGSPQGTKSQFLNRHFSNCRIPALPPDLEERMRIIEDFIAEPAWLVGSSLGGLSALQFAMSKPHLVKGMVLLAPAVGFYDETIADQLDLSKIQQTQIPAGIPAIVIAAMNDDVIPLVEIENLAARSPDKMRVKFIKADDDHSLNQSLDLLLESLKSLIESETQEVEGGG